MAVKLFRHPGRAETQDTDVMRGKCGLIVRTLWYIVKTAAQIGQGALRPVVFVADLHFQIQDLIVLKDQPHIKSRVLIMDGRTGFGGIGDKNGADGIRLQAEQAAK